MPTYRFLMMRIDGRPAEEDWILAWDDGEAIDLARMRLLMSAEFSKLTILRSGMSPVVLTRDRAPAQRAAPVYLTRAGTGAGTPAACCPDARRV